MSVRFYMCLAENGSHPPQARHYDPETAHREAERLARTLGGKVYVLAALAVVEKTDVRWETLKDTDSDDDLPF